MEISNSPSSLDNDLSESSQTTPRQSEPSISSVIHVNQGAPFTSCF